MDDRILRCTRSGTLLTLALSALGFGACAQQRSDEITHVESAVIFEELNLFEDPAHSSQSFELNTQGPQLIAGDWLAVQCAYVGNYFDGYDWSPFYATVETVDFE